GRSSFLVHQFFVQSAELKRAQKIRGLIERANGTVEGASHFRDVIFGIKAHVLLKVLHTLLRGPFAKVEVHGENYPRRTMHAPYQRADFLFRSFVKAFVPEKHLPPERVSFTPKWS